MLQALPAPVIEVSQEGSETDVIEVIGSRSEQSHKIDRRTFRIQQNAQSLQKDAAQLLRGLPAVTVSGDEQINLLGNGNVRIFVNGRPYSGDVKQYLRTLHGVDIVSIDVITNPSAQYSAEGTGGIINFNLRSRPGESASATLISDASSLGRIQVDGTYQRTVGDLTLELEGHVSEGRSALVDYERVRDEDTAGGTTSETQEGGRFAKQDALVQVVGKATFKPDSKTEISAMLDASRYRSTATRSATFEGLDERVLVDGRWRALHSSTTLVGEVNLDRKGSSEVDNFKATLRVYGKPGTREHNVTSVDSAKLVDATRKQELIGIYGQFDWQTGVGTNGILSLGSTLNFRRLNEDYTILVGALSGPQQFEDFAARNQTVAVYGTFQFTGAGFKVMPGLRVEHDRRRLTFPTVSNFTRTRISLFPTLHIERRIDKRVNFTLSYSRRIDRVPAEMLRPYLVFEDIITAAQGNPRLGDQTTDAYEVGLQYNRGKFDANLTFYDRRTHDLWSRNYQTTDAINIYSWTNSGSSQSIGAQLDVNMPLANNIRGNASFNVFRERVPVLSSGTDRIDKRLRYSFTSSLEWRGADRGEGLTGDLFELRLIHTSPSREFQLQNEGTYSLGASYTRNLTPTLSATLSGDYASDVRRSILAPSFREETSERKPIEFRIKLVKRLGPK